MLFQFKSKAARLRPHLRGGFERVSRSVIVFGLAAFSLAAWSAHAQDIPQMNLPRVQLSAGMHLIDVQLARTTEQRQIGLMMRQDMPLQEGMLFVFDQPMQQCFWMKNTLIPLTAAFLTDEGVVVNLADMQPHTTESHCSSQPVRYVLEMNQGWFAKKGIKPGAVIRGAVFSAKH